MHCLLVCPDPETLVADGVTRDGIAQINDAVGKIGVLEMRLSTVVAVGHKLSLTEDD